MSDSDVFMGKPAIWLVKKHGMDRMRTRGETDMARVTHAASHLSLAEVKQRMRTGPRSDRRQRWLIIYNALVEPRPAAEIARHGGVSSLDTYHSRPVA